MRVEVGGLSETCKKEFTEVFRNPHINATEGKLKSSLQPLASLCVCVCVFQQFKKRYYFILHNLMSILYHIASGKYYSKNYS